MTQPSYDKLVVNLRDDVFDLKDYERCYNDLFGPEPNIKFRDLCKTMSYSLFNKYPPEDLQILGNP